MTCNASIEYEWGMRLIDSKLYTAQAQEEQYHGRTSPSSNTKNPGSAASPEVEMQPVKRTILALHACRHLYSLYMTWTIIDHHA